MLARPTTAPDTIAPPRLEFGRAFRAFAKLVEDKEDTVQVFEIIQALSGKSLQNGYQRMLMTEKGGRQAYLRHELGQYFDDPEWLGRFPEGTVGAAYRAFRAQRGLTVHGLASESAKVNEQVDAAHPVAWYARRIRDVHDLWHTLTSYGTDALGEASLLAFTYDQTKNGAVAFIAAGAAREFSKSGHPQPYAKAILEGWRRSRRAARLLDEDYLELMAEPVDAARARLGLPAPRIYGSIPPEARNAYRDFPLAA
jgi:ubiquinone biosynthesis protein COQ4